MHQQSLVDRSPFTFYGWLLQQWNRDDDIGWFAHSAEHSVANEGCAELPSLTSKEDWLEFLRQSNERDDPPNVTLTHNNAPNAFEDAWVEFSRRKRTARAIPLALRARILERDGFRCRRCGATPATAQLVIDHIVPVAAGGDARPSNLQTLCEWCNIGKADRPPHPLDFLGGRE